MVQRPDLGNASLNAGADSSRGSPAASNGRKGKGVGPDPILALKVRDIWRFLLTQPVSFWLACIYLFFEYVRPQSIYEGMDALPWSQLALILCLVAVLFEKGFPRLLTQLSGLLLFFTAVVLLSSASARRPDIAWAEIDLYLSWVVIYVLIINTVNTERRFFVFLFSFLLYSLKMSQHGARSWFGVGFGFRDWGATGAPGWFHNSGEFGIQMCVFLPLALHFIWALKPHLPKWKTLLLWIMPVTAIMSIIGSSSRGAVVGAGLVGAWMVFRSRYRVRGMVALAVVSVGIFLVIPPEQKARFSSMGEDDTSVHRLTMWKDGIEIANDNPLLGIGYKNWLNYYGQNYGRGLPHNIFIEALAELGYAGLLGFLLLIGGTLLLNARTRKLVEPLGEGGRFMHHSALGLDGALVGYIGSGFFVTVLYYPYFWINLAMTVALHLAAQDRVRVLKKGQAAQAMAVKRNRQLHRVPVG